MDIQGADKQGPDSREPAELEDNRSADRMQVADVEHIRQLMDMADQCVTSVARVELPLLAEAQTCHLFCPSGPCVVSEIDSIARCFKNQCYNSFWIYLCF